MNPRNRAITAAVTICVVFGAFSVLRRRASDAIPAEPVRPADTALVAPDPASPAISAGEPKPAAASARPNTASGLRSGAEPGVPGATPAGGSDAVTAPATASAATVRYRAGEDPGFAERMGWPVKGPEALPGAILPDRRIVAYYGNPLSKRMGVLGEYETQEMLRRLDGQVDEWRRADPSTPVQPALHLITVVAQGDAGPSGKYRAIMRDTLVELVHGWAKSRNAILFIDIQVGLSDIRELLPKFDHFLSRPDVHLAIDPEFMMKAGHKPGAKIGTMDAADINYAAKYLADLVRKHNLPPKVFVIHRFTRGMVTNSKSIELRPEVQIVMHMDGWGAPWLKRDSYRDFIVREPVQYSGFKLFYHNDTKKGDPLMAPADLLKLHPIPHYIQYQ